MTLFDHVPLEIIIKILLHCDYKSLFLCCKSSKQSYYQLYQKDTRLWISLLECFPKGAIKNIIYQLTCSYQPYPEIIRNLSINEYKEVLRQVTDSKKGTLSWKKCHYLPEMGRIRPMEGHAVNLLLNRYLVIVEAWGGYMHHNSISMIDGICLPDFIYHFEQEVHVEGIPPFRYGFSSTVYQHHLYIYGGCTEGGYIGDCNDLYRVEFIFCHDTVEFPLNDENCLFIQSVPPKYWDLIIVRYSSNLAFEHDDHNSPAAGYSRAYHTCNVIHLNGKDYLMAIGGLHEGAECLRVELYDFQTNSWSPAEIGGFRPRPRFGLTTVAILDHQASEYCTESDWNLNFSKIDAYVVTGGAKGSDICRGGNDYQEIFLLSVERDNDSEKDSLLWEQMDINHQEFINGRGHCAVYFNRRIFYYGGGVKQDGLESVLLINPKQTKFEDPREPKWFTLKKPWQSKVHDYQFSLFPCQAQSKLVGRSYVRPTLPPPRLDAKAVVLGSNMIFFGGFSHRTRELGDLWAIELAPYGTKHLPFDRIRSSWTPLITKDIQGSEKDEDDELDDVIVNTPESLRAREHRKLSKTWKEEPRFIRDEVRRILTQFLSRGHNHQDSEEEEDDDEEEDDEDDYDDDDEDEDEYDDERENWPAGTYSSVPNGADRDQYDEDEEEDDTYAHIDLYAIMIKQMIAQGRLILQEEEEDEEEEEQDEDEEEVDDDGDNNDELEEEEDAEETKEETLILEEKDGDDDEN